jgi:hypothetical protein
VAGRKACSRPSCTGACAGHGSGVACVAGGTAAGMPSTRSARSSLAGDCVRAAVRWADHEVLRTSCFHEGQPRRIVARAGGGSAEPAPRGSWNVRVDMPPERSAGRLLAHGASPARLWLISGRECARVRRGAVGGTFGCQFTPNVPWMAPSCLRWRAGQSRGPVGAVCVTFTAIVAVNVTQIARSSARRVLHAPAR